MEQPKAGDKPVENISIPFDKPALLNEARRRNKNARGTTSGAMLPGRLGGRTVNAPVDRSGFSWPYIGCGSVLVLELWKI